MNAKPILFNTEMICAILDGRKTVTRRIVKPQQIVGILPDKCRNGMPEEFLKEKKNMFKPYCDMRDAELIKTAYNPPYQPGDILYVRETWVNANEFCGMSGITCGECHLGTPCFLYKATPDDCFVNEDIKWRPSIHMPKEAARIWLHIKDVRVERLQDMTVEDAEKEGAKEEVTPITKLRISALLNFMHIWDSTIKKSDIDRYGWDANPWVWVIDFERCEKPEGGKYAF